MKKKILASLFSATILLSTVAPVVSVIYADENSTDQTTEPVIPNDSSVPIEKVSEESESTVEKNNSDEFSEEQEIPEETTESSSVGDTEYIIQQGDTLWAISIKAKTTVTDLSKLNDIQNMDLIFTGSILKLE